MYKKHINLNYKRNLLAIRKLLKLSQEKFAEKLGIPRDRYQSYEQRSTSLSIETAVEFCKILDIEPHDFLFGTISTYPKSEESSQSVHEPPPVYATKKAETISSLLQDKEDLRNLVTTKDELIEMLKEKLSEKEHEISLLKKTYIIPEEQNHKQSSKK